MQLHRKGRKGAITYGVKLETTKELGKGNLIQRQYNYRRESVTVIILKPEDTISFGRRYLSLPWFWIGFVSFRGPRRTHTSG